MFRNDTSTSRLAGTTWSAGTNNTNVRTMAGYGYTISCFPVFGTGGLSGATNTLSGTWRIMNDIGGTSPGVALAVRTA